MSDYGVKSTGYVRKPLSVFLAELEAAMITEFGPGVIQTPQSPLGQLNGLMADLLAEIDERLLDVYQSYDPDQAEGSRLDVLARIRLMQRGYDDEATFRKAITNEGEAHVDVQDVIRALKSISGVTYAQVFVGSTADLELDKGSVAVVVIGGDDEEIALALRKYIVPGIDTYGNTRLSVNVDGYCRSISIVRPIEVQVNVNVVIRRRADRNGCPAPSTATVRQFLEASWAATRINGLDPSFYTVRSSIERAFESVEVLYVQGTRDGITYSRNEDVPVGFIEIANLVATVTEE